MINFIKGIIAGIGNILPGVSGSSLMVIFNVYEKSLNSISELSRFKNIKENIKYLFPVVFGIVLGTILFGNVIKFFMDLNIFLTTITFLGLIIGTIPSLIYTANKKGFNKKTLIFFSISFILGLFLVFAKAKVIQYTTINLSQGILLGFLYGLSTIIPGISSSVLFNIFGFYDMYLEIVSNPFDNINYIIYLLVGFSISLVILSNLITYLLNKYYTYTYYSILAFVLITTFKILRGVPSNNIELIIGMFLLIISSIFSYVFIKKIDK